MSLSELAQVPDHIGIIPDGNRRWAEARGLPKHAGYEHGLAPAQELVETAIELGVKELTFYGFTHDNTKRAAIQREAFQRACVAAVELLQDMDASVLVVGNRESRMFPDKLRDYRERRRFGRGLINVNLLVNYSWQWDLDQALARAPRTRLTVNDRHLASLGSAEVSRIDLLIRWGGRRRLSGFLPVQTTYADFYVVDALWPDFERSQLEDALEWYGVQDVTLGG